MSQIVILSLVDVVGALASQSLTGCVSMVDNNKLGGSTELGTDVLSTVVHPGDCLVWTCATLESEVYACLSGIVIAPEYQDYLKVHHATYPDSNTVFWTADLIKMPKTYIPYNLKFRLGNSSDDMTMTTTPRLIAATA